MNLDGIKALTFDTGGTILDWHSGVRAAFSSAGARHGVSKDWSALTNEFRSRSLKRMLKHGELAPATLNIDDVHRETLEHLLVDHDLEMFSAEDRRGIWWDAIHNLACRTDFPSTLPVMREKFHAFRSPF